MSIRHLASDITYIKNRTIPLYFIKTNIQNTFKRKCTFRNNVRFQKSVQNPLNPFIYKGYRDFKIMYVKFWFSKKTIFTTFNNVKIVFLISKARYFCFKKKEDVWYNSFMSCEDEFIDNQCC